VDNFGQLQRDLFQAWSIGLLSASLPWRMICAFTAAGILNQNQYILSHALKQTPTLARYFGRLQSTVARRLWAERAAVPVCSRYAQGLVELLTSVRRSVSVLHDLPSDFGRFWGNIKVDAATPIPLCTSIEKPLAPRGQFWESDEGWICSDSGWEVWTGTVEFMEVEWKTPSRSSVRTLMDGGDGPPMLKEGCTVIRGIDWDKEGSGLVVNGNDDGKDVYDAEKSRHDSEKRLAQDKELAEGTKDSSTDAPLTGDDQDIAPTSAADPAEENESENPADSSESPASPQVDPPSSLSESNIEPSQERVDLLDTKKDKKKKRVPSPKLPIGTVLSVEPWNGIPGMARRVMWNLTGIEGVYRYGGDGGLYDLCHVEVNSRETRIKKRHPLPESSEQCAARHGFGARATYSVLLRLKRNGDMQVDGDQIEYLHEGVLEWPDFGAGVRVKCTRHRDGAVTIEETQLLFGSKDSGWVARFGQPSFVPGCVTVLSPTKRLRPEGQAELDVQSSTSSLYEELLGSSSFDVGVLRNPADGSKLKIASEMRLYRGRQISDINTDSLPRPQSPLPPPITFDREYHASSLSLSRDGRTVSCVSSDGGRGTAFASMGFTKGVHYWEVKLEQADIGSVFIGVAEKPIGSGSGSSYSYDSPPRLNRWHGWGFVNFRATYTSGAERVFGSHCHAGDTVGVLLDCDAGRVSFFFDGLKYGEHILNDLGCAFENLSPFGFNVDGCGSGGAGQGAPSGFENGPSSRLPAQGTIRPRTLWPVIGLRNQGDRITLSSKWSTTYGVDSVISLSNIVAVEEVLTTYSEAGNSATEIPFPRWFVEEAFSEYKRWSNASWTRSATRGSGPYRLSGVGLDVDFDASPTACAEASAALGLEEALLAGDRVKLTRSAGRILELAEEAVVLGAYQGRLYYRIVSQKSEGGSLTEGGGRAWCWDESEVVGGLPFVSPAKGRGVLLPKLARFTCQSRGGLRVIYDNGAVLRSDLEIFDGSVTLGTIPVHTIIPKKDVLDRRVNSCGVVRFRVRCEEFGDGWISARIRGGTEELIVEPVNNAGEESDNASTPSFHTPQACGAAWYNLWREDPNGVTEVDSGLETLRIENVEKFSHLISQAVIPGLSAVESDSVLASAIDLISNYSDRGDAVESPFQQVASAISFALSTNNACGCLTVVGASAAANQSAASVFANFNNLPPLLAVMARVALLRSFNRRARLALPWMSVRPCQEGSAILGGLSGHGTSPDRAGRSRVADADQTWVQVPSIASKIRSLRGIFFTSIKRDFLQSIVEATTTPTPLSHDEYELPREIRTVRINRLKAGRAMLGDDRSSKRKYSVFAQLLSETKNLGGAGLRRGYVAKGHGGQKRAFKVKLIGEGVNDYSGPYREVFTDAMAEVIKRDVDGHCPLGVLDPSPNNASAIGENRDLFMFALNGRHLHTTVRTHAPTAAEARIRRSFASLMAARDENSREVEESLVFLGRLTGTAFRHGIPLDLPLPLASVWKALTEEPVSSAEKLRELDHLAHHQLENEKDAVGSPLLLWQQRMLNAFTEGLGNVLPVEILPLMTGEELRDTVCGNPEVDVDLLKQVVEYEGYSATDNVIGFFWETLNEMTNDERKQFLQFVWARNRLPMREADFDAPFKIQKDTLKTDQALPSASTCFFTLTLPDYSSQEILREKLLFAINNVTTMETDFQTNSGEIAEGYRAF
jgi:HECT-domain (ubiquitin-transferase)/SPRY domain